MFVENSEVPQVRPAMMEPGNYYIVEMDGYDDSGEERVARDFVWFALDKVPGQHKEVKVCRFCSTNKHLTFGQMPGARFFGPVRITVEPTEYEDRVETEQAQEKADTALGKIMAAARRDTQKDAS